MLHKIADLSLSKTFRREADSQNLQFGFSFLLHRDRPYEVQNEKERC